MIDWSKAPEGAVDVRLNAHGAQRFTNGKDEFWDNGVWSEMKFTRHHWPVVEVKADEPEPVYTDSGRAVDCLRGKNVVVTGAFSRFSREEIKDRLQQLGAVVKGSVNATTHVVIVGTDAGVKLAKARELNITTWSETDITAYFNTRLPRPTNKYDRTIIGKYGTGSVTVDVYRVLNAFGPLSSEIDHAVKKLLAPGARGAKSERQDLLEAIQSIEARLQYLEATDGD